MEKLINYQIENEIEEISNISGGNQIFEIIYSTEKGEYYKIFFDSVWDFKYTIEYGTLQRFAEYRKNNEETKFGSSIYLVESSDYAKYFEKQSLDILPVDELKHYILTDNVDTIIDVLANKEPKITKYVDKEKVELEELREYKQKIEEEQARAKERAKLESESFGF
ncbi:hypothetical protein ACFO26_06815 [Lactococcus nasutitermitis]|uniref:Uncharacterized protein n=1 Tax=Lactococcus nasutitermitis TaxID=1652957 RepID=A0ABV9JCX5_9LACT|nr:hypothetical protein [Lactococcus nasutitermitis]